ncbi:FKBP-type peptidyl-prolyl cis-trans isomerase [Ornithinicoccus hortensis]|uniref:peptidylprolyl isomerase n=1 Tax=Ornithinicoccus hortensis TaxID=82346 RepID=A0A542YT14_9MICO|nr:FKBP-type peptidyl-prolyl cis-trans isomerase [Ornithinicoccus hortensis]TQL51197.1 peptidylprolyl isomerase [Ornithinicoccus hortensis]
MRSPTLRLLSVALATGLLLTACGDGDGDGTDTDQSTATAGDDAAATSIAPRGDLADVALEEVDGAPALTLGGTVFAEGDVPFSAAETAVQEVSAGEGEEITAEHHVRVRYIMVNGTSGEEIVNSVADDQEVTFDLSQETLLPGLKNALVGTAPGAEVITAMTPADAFGEGGQPDLGVTGADTLIAYIEVVSAHVPLSQAEGTDVDPVEGLPTVEADGTTPAQVTIPDGEDPPTDLVVQPLIEGEGAEVQAGQQLTVHYTGVKWSDGEQFDSSLERGEPFAFQVGAGQVITGWDEGLVGQKVGSRVLLVIPPDQAYGDDDPNLGGETLVFVVDILDAD